MKILLYSYSFWPNIGGVESISHTLATSWSDAGHQVTVVTETPSAYERITNYPVVRQPDALTISQLVEKHDILHSNGASMRYLPVAWKHAKPFTCKHATYHLLCIDGCGWVNGKPAPLNPLGSLLYHWRVFGAARALPGFYRLLLRCLAAWLVSANVAITKYQMKKQWAPRQRLIYNPVEYGMFAVKDLAEARQDFASAVSTFTYLGRLITEKGVADLLRAFALLKDKYGDDSSTLSLRIIGGGPEEHNLKKLAQDLSISKQVRFLGELEGSQLSLSVKQSGICVLPSAWEEPMGIVCVELMSAGKPLIVSRRGGLAEGVGNAGLTFSNGNYQELAEVMERLHEDKALQQDLLEKSLQQAAYFNNQNAIQQYLDMFAELLHQDHA